MKKVLILVAAFSLLLAGVSFAGLSGGAHDLYTGNQKVSGITQICEPCHVPHNPLSTSPPLWNHTDSTAAGYTLYSSQTLNGTTSTPAAQSLSCMGCHDGTVGLDSYGGVTGTYSITSTSANLGVNLADDHPVGITYDTAGDDALYASGTTYLYASEVECASCHDVHEYTNTPFLRASLTGSAICLLCHNK
jgi:predicted CXXCH cytochrome family protein